MDWILNKLIRGLLTFIAGVIFIAILISAMIYTVLEKLGVYVFTTRN